MILNLTQHPATPEQVAAGVVDLPASLRVNLAELLTFEELPTRAVINARALAIAEIAKAQGATRALIGGAPFLMKGLRHFLEGRNITAFYAFSRRETREETLPDGSVRKTSVFRHAGFVPA